MGQASSDLSGEEVDDESRAPDLDISHTLRRRGVIINLTRRRGSREGTINQGVPREDQERPDGRSTGGGRNDLRVSYLLFIVFPC